MAGKIFVFICSFLFVQFASARIARDAPPPPPPPPSAPGSDLISNEQQFIKGIGDEAKTFDGLITEFKKIAEKNGESDAVKQLQSRVDEAVNVLKNQHPEAAKIIDQLIKIIKNLIEEIRNLGVIESAKQIKDLGNQILQGAVDALKNINKIQDTSKPKN